MRNQRDKCTLVGPGLSRPARLLCHAIETRGEHHIVMEKQGRKVRRINFVSNDATGYSQSLPFILIGCTTGISGFAECQGHSAKPNLHSAKNPSAKAYLLSVFCRALDKVFAECRHSAKLNPKKNPKKQEFLPKKIEFFSINGGPHRPPTHLRHFSREFHGYAADAIRTRDLPLCTYLLYYYTTLSLVSAFRFSSQYIILNRV